MEHSGQDQSELCSKYPGVLCFQSNDRTHVCGGVVEEPEVVGERVRGEKVDYDDVVEQRKCDFV